MHQHPAQLALRSLADPAVASHSQRFFKTGKGEYGEGDRFLGVRVPLIRQVAKTHQNSSINEILGILKSSWHEERLLALIMLVSRFQRPKANSQRTLIYRAYLKHTRYINNWDLVDSSAYQIVGAYLFDKDRSQLDRLAKSEILWERRIAIIATYFFIKHNQFDETIRLSSILLSDPEDLLHKAVGWMLREIGNRDRAVLNKFLASYNSSMPRTMLRYAIEKHSKEERLRLLKGESSSPASSRPHA
jgi:3-methyladenine DNA glycosylase AlkD